MKRKIWLILLLSGLATSALAAASFRIITQEAVMRQERRFFAPVVARIPYGDSVEELSRQGDWFRVRYRGKQGWVHVSAVEEQKFRLSDLAGQRAPETTREEVALAGKGFTPEVEKAFREKNPQLRYDLVSRIQSVRIPEEELQGFIQAGQLKEPGGEP
ncbi:MAG: SH3 domain-containing protein [Deltaproteobacteria bacterium]|nr:SH3 domain-containing protein [Deltaproteobacteria bacterium]